MYISFSFISIKRNGFKYSTFFIVYCFLRSKCSKLLARLLLCNAKIWLLDEPFNSLDYQGKDILINLIKARCMQKGIVIITNHNQNIKIENSSEINLEDFCDE